MGLGLFDDDFEILESVEIGEADKENLDFLKKILSSNRLNEKSRNDLETFIKKELEPFLESLNLKNKLKFIRILKKAAKKQEKLNYLNILEKNKIVAIGGGFSSGKSKFINSILGEDLLPVDLNPTTSIPTFIGNRDKSKKIKCLTSLNNQIELTEIELQKIAHEFEKKTGISLIRIIKILSIETEKFTKKDVFILDTPGYTKSDYYKKNDNTDSFVAKEHLSIADCLVWVIDIENGTIKNDDIQFLNQLEFNGPLFFILNKADKKTEKQIKSIKNEIEKTLKQNNIDFKFVIAYSSINRKEYFTNYINDIFDSKKSFEIEEDKEFASNFLYDIENYIEEEIELTLEIGKKIGRVFNNPKILCTELDYSILERMYKNNFWKKKLNFLKNRYIKNLKPELKRIIERI